MTKFPAGAGGQVELRRAPTVRTGDHFCRTRPGAVAGSPGVALLGPASDASTGPETKGRLRPIKEVSSFGRIRRSSTGRWRLSPLNAAATKSWAGSARGHPAGGPQGPRSPRRRSGAVPMEACTPRPEHAPGYFKRSTNDGIHGSERDRQRAKHQRAQRASSTAAGRHSDPPPDRRSPKPAGHTSAAVDQTGRQVTIATLSSLATHLDGLGRARAAMLPQAVRRRLSEWQKLPGTSHLRIGASPQRPPNRPVTARGRSGGILEHSDATRTAPAG